MEGFRKGSYLANPTGFRASPLFLNPILAGKQNTNFNALALPDYVSYADLQAQKAAAEAAEAAAAAAAAAAAQADNGNDSYGSIGNDYWNDQYQGDGGGWDNEGPGDFDSGGGWGGNPDDGGDYDDSFWSTGGTIPPMYAVEGNYVNDVLGVPDDRELFGNTRSVIGGVIDPLKEKAFKSVKAKVEQPAKTATGIGISQAIGALSKNNAAGLIASGLFDSITSGMSNQQVIDALNPMLDSQLYDAIYDTNEYGYSPGEITGIEQAPSYGINVGTVPDIDMTNPANYNVKDFVGVPETPAVSVPETPTISSWQDLNSYISNIEPVNPGPQTDFDAQLEAAISAELGDYTNSMETSTPSASPSMSDHAAVHGSADDASGGSVSGPSGSGGYGGSSGGYGDDGPGGGYGDGDSDSGSGQDGANSGGMGGGMGGGNDSFRSAGGRIYASQGGYVNSVGGK
jgi:hypothetical protein